VTTDTSERGLDRLICTALAGHPCEPPPADTAAEPPAGYGGVGWRGGSHLDHDREAKSGVGAGVGVGHTSDRRQPPHVSTQPQTGGLRGRDAR